MLRHLSWETGAFTVTLNTRLLYWYAASKQAKVRKFEMLMRCACTGSKFLTGLWIQDLFKIYYVMNSDPDMLEQENLPFREPTQIFPQCNWVFETFFQVISSSIYLFFLRRSERYYEILLWKGPSWLTNDWQKMNILLKVCICKELFVLNDNDF